MRRTLVDFGNVTVTVLIGAYLVLLTLFNTDGLQIAPAGLTGGFWPRFFFFLIGVLLVWMNISILVKDWKAAGWRQNIRINTDQGMTEVSVPSLEMQILRDLRAESDVVDPVVTLKTRGEGKPMLCVVELKLRRQPDIIRRGDAIKRKVRDIVDQIIPGGLTVEVLLEVRDIVNDSLRNSADGSSDAGEFNGPVYTDVTSSDGV